MVCDVVRAVNCRELSGTLRWKREGACVPRRLELHHGELAPLAMRLAVSFMRITTGYAHMRAYRDFRTHPKSGNRFAVIFRAFSGIANLLREARFEQCKYRCGREKQRMRQVVGEFARVKNMRISAYTRVLMCFPDSGRSQCCLKKGSVPRWRFGLVSIRRARHGLESGAIPLYPLPKGGIRWNETVRFFNSLFACPVCVC